MIKKKELCNSTKAVKVQQKSDSLYPSKMMVMHQKGIGQPELKPHDSMVCGGERQTSTKVEGRPPWADGKRTASHSRIKPHSSKALNAFVSLVVWRSFDKLSSVARESQFVPTLLQVGSGHLIPREGNPLFQTELLRVQEQIKSTHQGRQIETIRTAGWEAALGGICAKWEGGHWGVCKVHTAGSSTKLCKPTPWLEAVIINRDYHQNLRVWRQRPQHQSC